MIELKLRCVDVVHSNDDLILGYLPKSVNWRFLFSFVRLQQVVSYTNYYVTLTMLYVHAQVITVLKRMIEFECIHALLKKLGFVGMLLIMS